MPTPGPCATSSSDRLSPPAPGRAAAATWRASHAVASASGRPPRAMLCWSTD